jgi:DNA polymerase-3 subunit delta
LAGKGDGGSGFRGIEDDLKTGGIDRAAPILLCGAEVFLVDHYEKKLAERFGGGASAFLDLNVFRGGEAKDEEIMSACDTVPMLAPRRVVIVKNHPGLSGGSGAGGPAGASAVSSAGGGASRGRGAGKTQKNSGLEGYLPALPETVRLIFTAAGVNKTRTLYKALAKAGRVYEFSRLSEDEARSFARKRFKAMGLAIPFGRLGEFLAQTGYLDKDSETDLFGVANEAAKLGAFVRAEGRGEVTSEDIAECLSGTLQTDVFAVLDAISNGRKAESVRLLENSLALGESPFRLLSLFTGHFEIMLGYKEMQEKGYSPSKMMSVFNMKNDWRLKRLGGFASRFSKEKLRAILHRLYNIDGDIKSGNISDRLALTLLIAEM